MKRKIVMNKQYELQEVYKSYIQEFGINQVRLIIPHAWKDHNKGYLQTKVEYHDENRVIIRAGSYNYSVDTSSLFPTS